MRKPLRIAVVGEPWLRISGIRPPNFAYAHANPVRPVMLANAFARRDDCRATLLLRDPSEDDVATPLGSRIARDEMPLHFDVKGWDVDPTAFDVLVSIQGSFLRHSECAGWKDVPTAIFGDLVPPDADVQWIAADCPPRAREFAWRFPTVDVRHGVWGVTAWPRKPDPYHAIHEMDQFAGMASEVCRRPVVIYAGLVYNRNQLRWLNRLADHDDFETWFVGLFPQGVLDPEASEPSRLSGLTDRQRRLLNPRLRLISDVLGATARGHGPAAAGTFSAFLEHAAVGLSFYNPGAVGCSCKLYEYWGCGLPAVCESDTNNADHVLDLRGGMLFRQNDFDGLVQAVRLALARYTSADRERLRCEAVARWGWDAIAARWARVFRSALEI